MFNKKITKIKRFLCLMQGYGIMKLQKSTFSFGPQITLQQGDMDMKKRVTFLAALLVAACFGATVAMAEGSAKVTAQSGLNMRQGPGINYNVVTVLNNGATVNVVTPDDGNGWTYVTSGKNAGLGGNQVSQRQRRPPRRHRPGAAAPSTAPLKAMRTSAAAPVRTLACWALRPQALPSVWTATRMAGPV